MAEKSYQEADMERMLRESKAQSWKELATYIEDHGDNYWPINEKEADDMLYDVKQLAEKNVPFTSDPRHAYLKARQGS